MLRIEALIVVTEHNLTHTSLENMKTNNKTNKNGKVDKWSGCVRVLTFHNRKSAAVVLDVTPPRKELQLSAPRQK